MTPRRSASPSVARPTAAPRWTTPSLRPWRWRAMGSGAAMPGKAGFRSPRSSVRRVLPPASRRWRTPAPAAGMAAKTTLGAAAGGAGGGVEGREAPARHPVSRRDPRRLALALAGGDSALQRLDDRRRRAAAVLRLVLEAVVDRPGVRSRDDHGAPR